MLSNDEKLQSLLKDLHEMSVYLHGRGDKTHLLSLKFAENAEKNPSNREFDLNQSRMLEYQRHIWNEIAVLTDKIIKNYE